MPGVVRLVAKRSAISPVKSRPCAGDFTSRRSAGPANRTPQRSVFNSLSVACDRRMRSVLSTHMSEVSRILEAIDRGDAQAASQLLPLVYDELRRLAAAKLAHEGPGQTLQPTALVHEAYLRLVGPSGEARKFKDRGHFLAAAATAMRRILIDKARRKRTAKHGGGLHRQPVEGVTAPEPDHQLLALDEALGRLAARDPVKGRLVELRYFAGLTSDEAAEVLGISPTTADRHWAYARAWLRAELRGG